MAQHILITGGAGFIGSHVSDALLARGHHVRVLDVLSPQVHAERGRPGYLADDVELQIGDVRDPEAVRRALDGIDAVFHFAAMVGVGQSMYQVAEYTSVNAVGTGVLLEALIAKPVGRVVVASSMSIYGEGLYVGPDGRPSAPADRTLDQLRAGDWETRNAAGEPLTPVPTPETKTPSLKSIYALSKFDQERMCLLVGDAYRIPTVALRFFNVYGTRQALSNPYTGVLAIFAARYLNGNAPVIFEDGLQQRDFVSVHDVAAACVLALERTEAAGHAFNVGSGERYTIAEVATRMAAVLGTTHLEPEVTRQYRVGDIRHCVADITRAREVLGYTPSRTLDDGLVELAGWLAGQRADDRVGEARRELATRGLTV
jgi:dTDP-L-rhamnose 4-epimerase